MSVVRDPRTLPSCRRLRRTTRQDAETRNAGDRTDDAEEHKFASTSV